MLRGPAHSARGASSGTCAPSVGVATVLRPTPRNRSRGGCSEPDSDSVASCRHLATLHCIARAPVRMCIVAAARLAFAFPPSGCMFDHLRWSKFTLVRYLE